jgi:soluble lytic murein transglycosylase-like protein
VKIVLAAIIWLAPNLGAETSELYAGLIAGHAEDAKIDPLLVVAIIHLESRFKPHAKSKTNDYGLMQVHVSATTYRRYRGRETMLFDPDRNIRLGVRLMKNWKAYHDRTCTGPHPWWIHFNHGCRVLKRGPRAAYGDKVDAVYQVLRTRFQTI